MTESSKTKNVAMSRWFLLCAFCLIALPVYSQTEQAIPPNPKSPAGQDEGEPDVPGDWAPELLDAILTSPNPDAHEALLDAAFAAGPPLIPQLEAALKDDRTAEFAAQSLAFIGGPKAFVILGKLVTDTRDLDLRRFFYGALGELRTPEGTRFLMDAVAHSDDEPDRTVTEAAIIALTVRSDLELLPRLREAQTKITDVVIRDDVENAIDVIQARTQYLAPSGGKLAGGSIEAAVRTYFSPALELLPAPAEPVAPATKSPAARNTPAHPAGKAEPSGSGTAERPAQPKSDASVEIQRQVLSPDKTRALAHVVFQDPMAMAYYDMVLKKQFGEWVIASVWLGNEVDKTPPAPSPAPPPKK